MSPKELATLANVTPNMIYTYLRNGRIDHTRHLETKAYVIDDEYGVVWAYEHNQKRAERRERNRAMLESQLRGR